ncbi:amidase [Rhodococcus sp. NM-2]|uniref:amidase n=1 Tax=Rhodococcus sp. NM-2 TaxID=3401174 RepID=UPI003AACC7A9
MSTDFSYLTAFELRRLISTKQVSPVEVTEAALTRMDDLEPTLNAFVTATPDVALKAARAAEAQVLAGGQLGKLHGIPLSVKDLIDVEGVRTTFGSKTRADNVARADAPSVERIKSAGSCILGKTTTTEFGAKAGGGDSPLTGVTRNPWNTDKSPGGSSSGAAASVAAGVTPFALGTDGGGSVRIPAALCGLVGVKAQYGRVPVFPTSATPSLGHVGAIARSVRDAALLIEVMSGFDARDPSSVAQDVPDLVGACGRGTTNMRVAWSPTLGYASVSDEVRELCESAVGRLEEAGCHVDLIDEVLPDDPIGLWEAEFYAGVGLKLREELDHSRHLLDPDVAEAITQALYRETLADYFAKFFQRFELREHVRQFFSRYDVLVTPTLPVAELGAGINVPPELPDRGLVSWAYYTYPFNLTGNPAASIPCGFTSSGMPVGLQVVTGTNRDADLFRIAGTLEEASPWGHLRPL